MINNGTAHAHIRRHCRIKSLPISVVLDQVWNDFFATSIFAGDHHRLASLFACSHQSSSNFFSARVFILSFQASWSVLVSMVACVWLAIHSIHSSQSSHTNWYKRIAWGLVWCVIADTCSRIVSLLCANWSNEINASPHAFVFSSHCCSIARDIWFDILIHILLYVSWSLVIWDWSSGDNWAKLGGKIFSLFSIPRIYLYISSVLIHSFLIHTISINSSHRLNIWDSLRFASFIFVSTHFHSFKGDFFSGEGEGDSSDIIESGYSKIFFEMIIFFLLSFQFSDYRSLSLFFEFPKQFLYFVLLNMLDLLF